MEKKSCKKTSDTKIKNKGVKPKTKPQTPVTPPPVHETSGFNSLQTMRQDANLQIQVEKRLQELASLNNAGTKLKSLGGGGGVLLKCWSPTASNGPVNTFSRDILKRESCMISYQLLNGWLALVAS